MKQPKFNSEQISELLSNRYVIKCKGKSISYSKEFKLLAVKQYTEGMAATQIFKAAGLSQKLVGEYVPDNCLHRWKKKFNTDGEAGLMIDGRRNNSRGRPKIKGLTDAERIKRLEIENTCLKAKYDFLVKLRAQRKR